MAPKRGQKRKAAGSVDAPANTTTNGDTNQIAPPNVETWPGWVEMESEPVSYPKSVLHVSIVLTHHFAGALQLHARGRRHPRHESPRIVGYHNSASRASVCFLPTSVHLLMKATNCITAIQSMHSSSCSATATAIKRWSSMSRPTQITSGSPSKFRTMHVLQSPCSTLSTTFPVSFWARNSANSRSLLRK